MANRIDTFFDELGTCGHDAALRSRTATVRFDVISGKNTDSWIVAIKHGDIAVARNEDEQAADCLIRVDRTLFERIVEGETSPMAATLRGALITEGNIELLVAANRLLAARPNQTEMERMS
jgi:hypothetical protein